MYGWIWRKLPFGKPGKIIGSLVLIIGIGLLLWFYVFPALDPVLPFNSGQLSGNDGGGGSQQSAPPATPPSYRGDPSPLPSSEGGNGDLPGN